MIIKDVNGEKLSLTKTRLTEVSGELFPTAKYYMKLSDLKKAYEKSEEEISWSNMREVLIQLPKPMLGMNSRLRVTLYTEDNKIGCRTFSPRTFAKILKAAGVRKTKRKPAKKGKK